MAEHGKVEYGTAAGNDYAEHEATYRNVMKLAKVGSVTVLIAVVALGIHGTVGSFFWTFFPLLVLVPATFGYGMMRNSVVPGVAALALLLLVWALLV